MDQELLVPQYDEVLSRMEKYNNFLRGEKRLTVPASGAVFGVVHLGGNGIVPVNARVFCLRDIKHDGKVRRVVSSVRVRTVDGLLTWTPLKGVDMLEPVAVPVVNAGMTGELGPCPLYATTAGDWAIHNDAVSGKVLIARQEGDVWLGVYEVDAACFLRDGDITQPGTEVELTALKAGDLLGELAAKSPATIGAGAPRLPEGYQPWDRLLEYAPELSCACDDLQRGTPSDWPDLTVLASVDTAIFQTPLPWNLALGAAVKVALSEGLIHACASEDGEVQSLDFNEHTQLIKISGRIEKVPLDAVIKVKIGDQVLKGQTLADYLPPASVEELSLAQIRAALGTSVKEVTKQVLLLNGVKTDTRCLLDTKLLPEVGKDFLLLENDRPRLFYDLRKITQVDDKVYYIRAHGDMFQLTAGMLHVRPFSSAEEANHKRKAKGKAPRHQQAAVVQ